MTNANRQLADLLCELWLLKIPISEQYGFRDGFTLGIELIAQSLDKDQFNQLVERIEVVFADELHRSAKLRLVPPAA